MILLVVFSLVAAALARPEGAPNGACDALVASLQPHGPPQSPVSNPTPYQVTVTPFPASGIYVPNGVYTVTLKSCGNSTIPFRGLLVVAQDPTGTRLGSWTPANNMTQTTCAGMNGLTHTNRMDKLYVTATWTAPASGSGSVQFRYAVVQTLNVHWSNVYEASLFDPASSGASMSYVSKVALFLSSLLLVSLAL